MIYPDIKLKKDNLEVEYYDSIPIKKFITNFSPNVDMGRVFVDIQETNETEDFSSESVTEESVSFIRRILEEDNFTTEFTSFIENPYDSSGIAYKRVDDRYSELANILYIYKTGEEYYIQYQYPVYSSDHTILIARGFIDTSIYNYNIEISDTKDAEDEESFCKGLSLTCEHGNAVYEYRDGMFGNGLDFTVTISKGRLDEEELDLFTIGEPGDRYISYIIRTFDVNYVYIRNLETDIEYIYEEVAYEDDKTGTPLFEYLFLSRCEDGTFYDEKNNVINSTKNNLYDLYVLSYMEKIESFQNTYLRPCGMVKGFPEITQELFSLDSEISKSVQYSYSDTSDLSFDNQNAVNPGAIVRKLNRNY